MSADVVVRIRLVDVVTAVDLAAITSELTLACRRLEDALVDVVSTSRVIRRRCRVNGGGYSHVQLHTFRSRLVFTGHVCFPFLSAAGVVSVRRAVTGMWKS